MVPCGGHARDRPTVLTAGWRGGSDAPRRKDERRASYNATLFVDFRVRNSSWGKVCPLLTGGTCQGKGDFLLTKGHLTTKLTLECLALGLCPLQKESQAFTSLFCRERRAGHQVRIVGHLCERRRSDEHQQCHREDHAALLHPQHGCSRHRAERRIARCSMQILCRRGGRQRGWSGRRALGVAGGLGQRPHPERSIHCERQVSRGPKVAQEFELAIFQCIFASGE